jgi:hypothetical protein
MITFVDNASALPSGSGHLLTERERLTPARLTALPGRAQLGVYPKNLVAFDF